MLSTRAEPESTTFTGVTRVTILDAWLVTEPSALLVRVPVPRRQKIVPPELRLEDMQVDVDRVIASQARHFTDQSCVFLHTDELESEGRVALVHVLNKGWLTRAKTRSEFFKIVKTAVANRMRSVLGQHRFTQRRTGVKPPPRHQRNVSFESIKPKEISLDDPDSHLQIGDDSLGVHTDETDVNEMRKEIKERCNWFDRAVLDQLENADLDALNLAWLDAYRGKRPGQAVKIKLTNAHRALAGQVPLEVFQKAVLRIQQVYNRLREMSEQDDAFQRAVGQLCEIFQLTVPKSATPMLVRRMFTIASHDNWQKMTPQIEALLNVVGAKGPYFNQDSMSCFGVIHDPEDNRCQKCGVRVSCATQTANQGLDTVTFTPQVLREQITRIPVVVPQEASDRRPMTSNMRDMVIIDYLYDHFRRVTHQGETYFQPEGYHDKQKLIFCIGERTIPFRLRFCNPSPDLRKALHFVNKGYYAHNDMDAEEVIELINEHTKQVLTA